MINPRVGTYALVLVSQRSMHVRIGRTGKLETQPGFYVYVGSAHGPGGVRARIAHHQKRALRPHWHIDYLRAALELREVWFTYDPVRREHAWAMALNAWPGGALPVTHFGCSDCECDSHLYFFHAYPSRALFRRTLSTACPDHARMYSAGPWVGSSNCGWAQSLVSRRGRSC
ncbi:MAG: DUF123 domain-containing protein [Acidiferrobacterales bacterium]